MENQKIPAGSQKQREHLMKCGGGGMYAPCGTDVFLVSYPKSGSTWIRSVIAAASRWPKPVSMVEIEALIPDIHRIDSQKLARYSNPKTIKTHRGKTPSAGRAVYIVRNPASVAVSYFYYSKRCQLIADNLAFTDFLNDFLLGNCFPKKLSWNDHTKNWYAFANEYPERVIIKRYEDLVDNTFFHARSILTFLGVSIQQSYLEELLAERTSFSALQKLEEQDLASTIFTTKRSEISFFRSGRTDEWEVYFDDHLREKLKSTFHEGIELAGYEDLY